MSNQVIYDRDAVNDLISKSCERIEKTVRLVVGATLSDQIQRKDAKSLVKHFICEEFDFFIEALANAEVKS